MSVLIVLAGLLAYRGGGGGAWLFDDQVAILGNESIRQVWPLSKPLSPPADTPVARRPLVNLSFALNHALGGFDPRGYLFVNLVLHLLSALLLLGIVRRTLLTPRLRSRDGDASLWLAGAIAGLWAVHPLLLTESILYITQRTELLMALWYLLALYSLIRSADAIRPARWHAVTVLACALGMLSKEVMVTAPLVLCLYDWMFLAESWPTLWARRGRLYVGLALTWGVLAWLMVTGGRTSPAGFVLRELPLARSLATQAGVILYYARLAVWPHPLVIDYDDWPVAASVAAMWPQMLAVGLLILATGYGLIRRAPWAFLLAWSLAILAPTSLLPILTEAAAERRMYLPPAGVVALAVFGAEASRRRLRCSPRAAGVIVGIAVLACGVVTAQRSLDYRSDVAMWTDAVAKRPNNVRAHDNLGLALGRAGRFAESSAHHAEAARLAPKVAQIRSNLGVSLGKQGRFEEARQAFEDGLALAPNSAELHTNLGALLERMGHADQAMAQYDQAQQLDPSLTQSHYNRGVALSKQGRWQEAVDAYHAALARQPNHAQAHFNLSMALVALGRDDDAIAHFRDALSADPKHAKAEDNLGLALGRQGQQAEAVTHLRQAAGLRPDVATPTSPSAWR